MNWPAPTINDRQPRTPKRQQWLISGAIIVGVPVLAFIQWVLIG